MYIYIYIHMCVYVYIHIYIYIHTVYTVLKVELPNLEGSLKMLGAQKGAFRLDARRREGRSKGLGL